MVLQTIFSKLASKKHNTDNYILSVLCAETPYFKAFSYLIYLLCRRCADTILVRGVLFQQGYGFVLEFIPYMRVDIGGRRQVFMAEAF